MKPSGLSWAPEVPAHWTVKKLGFLAALKSGDSITSDDISDIGRYAVYGGNGLRGYTDRYTHEGQHVLIGRQGALCGNVNYAEGQFWASEHAVVVLPREPVVVRWLGELLRAMDLNQYSVSAAQPGLAVETVAGLRVPIPPLREQRAIAEYLERETTQLDALVAAKEQLLVLLAEKRRALITRAVTRGLDPRAPVRESGISWLGKIPTHWELKRLKRVGRSIIGLTFDPADTVTDGSGVLVLRASNVRDQQIVLDDNLFVLMDIPEALRTREGDILICSRSGSRTLIGKNALIDKSSAGLTFGAFMTVFRSPHNAYLFYVFNSPLFDYQAGAFSTSTINQLTVETLNSMEVPLPPSSEQKAIVASLRHRTSELDRVVEATKQTIVLLRERRSVLIAAAITGQIDMAQAAA
jgi:type I restriction enzyme S subunit